MGISGIGLQFYEQGIFDNCRSYINHAVLLVGYVSGIGWKIKNSWGKEWGMNGYFWLAEGNSCEICMNAYTVTTEL